MRVSCDVEYRTMCDIAVIRRGKNVGGLRRSSRLVVLVILVVTAGGWRRPVDSAKRLCDGIVATVRAAFMTLLYQFFSPAPNLSSSTFFHNPRLKDSNASTPDKGHSCPSMGITTAIASRFVMVHSRGANLVLHHPRRNILPPLLKMLELAALNILQRASVDSEAR